MSFGRGSFGREGGGGRGFRGGGRGFSGRGFGRGRGVSRGGDGGWSGGRGRGGRWNGESGPASTSTGGYKSHADSDNPNRHPMVNPRAFSAAQQTSEEAVGKTIRSTEEMKAKKAKKWRLIVRNLPFTITEEDLAAKFRPFGTISEIKLPMKKSESGESVPRGFGFIQYAKFPDAHSAFKTLNRQPLSGRPMALDWAIPKDDYDTAKAEIKTEKPEEQSEDVKPDVSDKRDKGTSRKTFSEDDEDVKPIKKEEDTEEDEDGEDEDEEDDEEDEDEEELSHSESSSTAEDDEKEAQDSKKKKKKEEVKEVKPDQAILEGRTVFCRNLSFDTTKENFEEFARKYGEIKYALICIYPDTDHSKGCGFVQFKEPEGAQLLLDACLRDEEKDEGGTQLDGRWVLASPALSRKDAETKQKEREAEKTKTAKDKRNLHLLRLGVIRAGTEAAAGMSDYDAKKRLQIQAAAAHKIKNLHIFVSPTRLCIHNLPATLDDKDLKKLVRSSVADKSGEVKECRIMRDRERVVNKTLGLGKSRGFAFVEWTQHDHALACLRALNNSPKIFSDVKRPIVEFSLENMVALNQKKARLERSMQRKAPQPVQSEEADPSARVGRLRKAVNSKAALAETKKGVQKSGAKPLPSHFGPKIRHRKRDKSAGDGPPAKVPKVAKPAKPGQPAKLSRKERRAKKARDIGHSKQQK